MILVTGAAGKTGKAVVEALAAKGARVRAFIAQSGPCRFALGARRRRSQLRQLRGCPARWRRPRHGAQAVYHICPNVSRDEVAFARAVAAAARTHGVKRFVYHSVLHPQIEAMPHHWQKMRVEEMLFAIGPRSHRPAADRLHAEYSRRVGRHRPRRRVQRFPIRSATRLSLVDLDDVGRGRRDRADPRWPWRRHLRACRARRRSARPRSRLCSPPRLGRDVRAEDGPLAAWEARARAAGMGEYELRDAQPPCSAITRSTA